VFALAGHVARVGQAGVAPAQEGLSGIVRAVDALAEEVVRASAGGLDELLVAAIPAVPGEAEQREDAEGHVADVVVGGRVLEVAVGLLVFDRRGDEVGEHPRPRLGVEGQVVHARVLARQVDRGHAGMPFVFRGQTQGSPSSSLNSRPVATDRATAASMPGIVRPRAPTFT
jgi:hypothetical protein